LESEERLIGRLILTAPHRKLVFDRPPAAGGFGLGRGRALAIIRRT
jgi:hypothetical protein